LSDCVHFLGWRRDLAPVYADLDALALTSINEGTPVALIEALAAGVPIAATAVGGVPDVLAGGTPGAMVPMPASPEPRAAALLRALSPAPRTRADGLREPTPSEYGVERLCRDLASLYLSLAKEH